MESPAEHAASQLAKQFDGLKSVDLRVRTHITNKSSTSDRPPAFDTTTEHYIQTMSGSRFCEFASSMGDQAVGLSRYYFDGSRGAEVTYSPKDLGRQQQVLIRRNFWLEANTDRKQIPKPFLFLYVGREPLWKALSKARLIGQSDVIGHPCDAFLFDRVRWGGLQDQVFHLDSETSVPLKVEAFRDETSRLKNEPLWVWTARSLDRVDARSLPLKSIQESFGPDGRVMLTWDTEVLSIEFDRGYPASTFWPVLQPGVTVDDTITGKTYQTPGERPAIPSQSGSASPVRADPPASGTSLDSGVALAIGCAVLLAAAAVWLRSRKS